MFFILFKCILMTIFIETIIRFFERCEKRSYSGELGEYLIRVIISFVGAAFIHGESICIEILTSILIIYSYIQAYYDVKQQQVYKILTIGANILFWIAYVLFFIEQRDVMSVLIFLLLNMMFCKLFKCYAAGDMKILCSIVPIIAIRYTDIILLQRLLLLLLIANIIFLCFKLLDLVIYKKKMKEPKEFVPSILIATILMLVAQ